MSDVRSETRMAELAPLPAELGRPFVSRRQRFEGRVNVWLPRVLALLLAPALVLIWKLIADAELVHRVLLPEVSQVAAAFPRLVRNDTFTDHLMQTLAEIAIGYGVGVAVGFALGLLLSTFPLLRRAYFPLVSGFVSIPYVVFTPIIITWLGFGIASKVAVAALISFFPVLITTMAGLEMVSEHELRLMRSLQASRWQIFRAVRFRNALPAIFGGLKIAMTLAIVGAIIAEFVGSDGGLGFLLLAYRAHFDIATVFAIIFIFAFIGGATFLLLELIERKVVFWKR